MSYDDDVPTPGSFYDGCIKTYGAATRLMGEVWEETVGEPMGKLSGYPKDRFRQALDRYAKAIATGTSGLDKGIRGAAQADDVLKSFILDEMKDPFAPLAPDVDDVAPSLFKKAIWDEALALADDEPIDVNLDEFLRAVVKRIGTEMNWSRRINVGENRHFPRMVQWLREVEYDTTTDDGVGLRLLNRAGRGRVAAYPTGPQTLKVRVDASYL